MRTKAKALPVLDQSGLHSKATDQKAKGKPNRKTKIKQKITQNKQTNKKPKSSCPLN